MGWGKKREHPECRSGEKWEKHKRKAPAPQVGEVEKWGALSGGRRSGGTMSGGGVEVRHPEQMELREY